MDQPVDAIAENLRHYRETLGLSLEGLAELTGVSKSMLRQIEMGKSSPTITTLWKIAEGLRVPIWSLLNRQTTHAEVRPFRSQEFLRSEGRGYRDYLLIPFSPQQPCEIHFLELKPGSPFKGDHNSRATVFLFIIVGSVRVSIEEEEYKVQVGEFCRFQAVRPHSYECIGDKVATAILQLNYDQML